MPQIGWLEILAVVIVAILVLGPKEFPVALKKIGSYVGKIKGIFSNFQKEVTSLSDDVDIEKVFCCCILYRFTRNIFPACWSYPI